MMKFLLGFLETPDSMPAYKQRGWVSSQKGDIPLLGLTLAFSCFVFALEAILDLRQYDKFKDALASKKIPKLLQGVITQETFDKSNDCKQKTFYF
jgi:hypothetical protein